MLGNVRVYWVSGRSFTPALVNEADACSNLWCWPLGLPKIAAEVIQSPTIGTRSHREHLRHSITVTTDSPGLDRATVAKAKQQASDWARDNQHKVVSDIMSQGEYRVWVQPIPPGRLRTMAQLGRAA